MRQNEFDFIELIAASPILDSICPSMSRVAQSMSKDDRGRVFGRGGKEEWAD